MPSTFRPYKIIHILICLLFLYSNPVICYLIDASAGNFAGEDFQSFNLQQFKNKRLLSCSPWTLRQLYPNDHQPCLDPLAQKTNCDQGQWEELITDNTNQNRKRMHQNAHLSQLINQNSKNFKIQINENIANTKLKNHLNHNQANSNHNLSLRFTSPSVRNPNQENNQDTLFAFNGPFQPSDIEPSQREKAFQWTSMVDEDLNAQTENSSEQFAYYQKKYRISTFAELPFCIVVPTFNNNQNDRYLKNIKSIVMQNYTNQHIVIIDDNSNDKTGQLISQYLKQYEKNDEK